MSVIWQQAIWAKVICSLFLFNLKKKRVLPFDIHKLEGGKGIAPWTKQKINSTSKNNIDWYTADLDLKSYIYIIFFFLVTTGPNFKLVHLKALVLLSFRSWWITAPWRRVPVTAHHRDCWFLFLFLLFFCIWMLMKNLVLPHYSFAFHVPIRTCSFKTIFF